LLHPVIDDEAELGHFDQGCVGTPLVVTYL